MGIDGYEHHSDGYLRVQNIRRKIWITCATAMNAYTAPTTSSEMPCAAAMITAASVSTNTAWLVTNSNHNTMTDIQIALRLSVDEQGRIKEIGFPQPLPDKEIDFLRTFLDCLARAKEVEK